MKAKAVSVQGLVKRYPGVRAVDGISFEVESGEIYGLLGPNGAGKTTTIECLEGLRRPDRGTVRVLGLDPQRDRYELCERIGVQLQTTALYDRIKVREALKLFSSFYRRRGPWGKRFERLVEPLGLSDVLGRYYTALSGGQKQRLHIALALVHDPEIVFLDELTTGLDPQARRAVWDFLLELRERGTTLFLTTHYMEEAERLCDRVAILDHGKIIAQGRPAELIARLGGDSRIVFSLKPCAATSPARVDADELKRLPYVRRVERLARDGRETFVLYSERPSATLLELIKRAEEQGWPLGDLHVQRATLEDVFLTLTGRELRG